MTDTTTRYATGADLPGKDLPLSAEHRRELFIDSAIDPEVARERGYSTMNRPNAGSVDSFGRNTRDQLKAQGFPAWCIREDYYFPGLHIPQYGPAGDRYAGQFKPFRAVTNREGRPMRYASAKGATRLDVHPRWSKLSTEIIPPIQNHERRLWITEGVKKADALTSRGEATIALAGVFNWRNSHSTLGDWEEVRLKDREIVICFDADAVTKPHVAQAMARLGKWLRYKKASKVWFLTVPPGINDRATKGVDDWFAAGGSMKELERAFETAAPEVTDTEDRFTDARLAETLAMEVLDGRYAWSGGLGWLQWNGKRWKEVTSVTVLETVRQWALTRFAESAAALKLNDKAQASEVDGWRGMLASTRANTVLMLARGIVEREADEFDADPDLLNTPSGMVNLQTGELIPHDPDALCTKITSGSYIPGYRHEDWDQVLQVLPTETCTWIQTRVGQAITGYTTPDGVIPILKGGGENGKSLMFTDGLVPALGGYADVTSPKLFEKGQHSTEVADLRGQRLMVAEELTEGRSIDVTQLKRVADIGRAKARKTHKDNISFEASHSLFATTNYEPVINETDDGTWRRLEMVIFPFSYVKPGDPITNPEYQRRGDPTLKPRIKGNRNGQHDAMVTWAVEGARRWYANVEAIEQAVRRGLEAPPSVLLPPLDVRADKLAWRVSADRILGFWTACLVPDPAAYVLASELVIHFNEWLRESGHTAWSKETFHPRFREHSETKRHRVGKPAKKRTASIAGHIARRPSSGAFGEVPRDLPAQADVILGLRYRLPEDEV